MRCRELYYSFSDPVSPRARFTNATTGILAIIDVRIRLASRPEPHEDLTRESTRESLPIATSFEMESRNREKLEVIQQLGISESASIIELVNLAGKYGILEAQPPRENLKILEVLENLIQIRAVETAEKENSGGSDESAATNKPPTPQ